MGKWKALAAVALAACAQVVSAQSFTMKHIGDGYRQAVAIHGLENGSYWAGQFTMQFVGTAPDGYNQIFTAYCVDLLHILQSSEVVTLQSTNGLNPKGLSPSTGPKVAYLFNTYGPGIADNAHAAALQVAIWETLYDGGDPSGLVKGSSSSGGNVWFDNTDSTVLGYAQSYLQSLGSNTGEATWLQCVEHPNGANQDLITVLPDHGRVGGSVPEPGPIASLIGLCVGLSALGVRGRRRR